MESLDGGMFVISVDTDMVPDVPYYIDTELVYAVSYQFGIRYVLPSRTVLHMLTLY